MLKLQIIEAGLGWGGLPQHVVAPLVRTGVLRILMVEEFDVETIELVALRRRRRRKEPVLDALWERLRQ